VQRYLVEDVSPIPRCASCRTEWSEDFLAEICTKSFLTKEYRVHREQILVDAERARLPETQADAARYKTACELLNTINPRICQLQIQIRELPERIESKRIYMEFEEAYRNRVRTERARDGERDVGLRDTENKAYTAFMNAEEAATQASSKFYEEIRKLATNDYTQAKTLRINFGKLPIEQRGAAAAAAAAQQKQWTFVMRCEQPDCQGFVGTDWKCGLCAVKYCADCTECLAAAIETSHVCDTERLATARAIRREAKPCPKCAALISKIDGCDQMWCTQCRTAFSWRTGAIEVYVHNPHYYQWMRERGQTPAPPVGAAANPNELCLTDNEYLDQIITWCHRDRFPHYLKFLNWIMSTLHYMRELTEFREQMTKLQDDEWRRKLRVQRLVGELSDAKWMTSLQKKEKKTALIRNIIEVLHVFCSSVIDILRVHFANGGAVQGVDKTVDEMPVFKELNKLRNYCNTQFSKIGTRFNSTIPPYIMLRYDDTPNVLEVL
jgi:hypothetical protein